MKRFSRAAAAAVVLVCACWPSFAAEQVTPAVAARIAEAKVLQMKSDMAGALDKLRQASAVAGKTPLDIYSINRLVADIAVGQKNMKLADQAYEAMADSGAIPPFVKKIILHDALKLAYNEQHDAKVVAYAKELEPLGVMDSDDYSFAAEAAYQLRDDANAERYGQLSVAFAAGEGRVPGETVLKVLQGAQYALKHFAALRDTDLLLAGLTGADDNWDGVIDTAILAGGEVERDRLDIFRLANYLDATSPDHLDSLAKTALAFGFPGEVVHVIKAGIAHNHFSNGDFADILPKAQADSAAIEKGLGLVVTAARLSKTGQANAKLADVFYGLERSEEAERAAKSALAMGMLDDVGLTNLVLGEVLTAEHKYDEAIAVFAKVTGAKGRLAVVQIWSGYAQSSKNRGAR